MTKNKNLSIMKTYLAKSTENRAYICEASSKKIMKYSGMNMKLKWEVVKDFDTAKNIIACEGLELRNVTTLK
jgi:hypothetical protein